jgi:hypothetical protein
MLSVGATKPYFLNNNVQILDMLFTLHWKNEIYSCQNGNTTCICIVHANGSQFLLMEILKFCNEFFYRKASRSHSVFQINEE